MRAIHRALIEAIVYIETSEGTDDQEDNDVSALESIFAELNRAEPDEIEALLMTVRQELGEAASPARREALLAITESLAD